jgi:hypothetical protein
MSAFCSIRSKSGVSMTTRMSEEHQSVSLFRSVMMLIVAVMRRLKIRNCSH